MGYTLPDGRTLSCSINSRFLKIGRQLGANAETRMNGDIACHRAGRARREPHVAHCDATQRRNNALFCIKQSVNGTMYSRVYERFKNALLLHFYHN